MARTTEVFALDNGANKYETMTKEQIIAAITQAVNDGTISNIDAGFITKIQEMNKKGELSFWVGTQEEFNLLPTKDKDTLYLFTDDPLVDDIYAKIQDIELTSDTNFKEVNKNIDSLSSEIKEEVNNIKNGTTIANHCKRSDALELVTFDNTYKVLIEFGEDWENMREGEIVADLKNEHLPNLGSSQTYKFIIYLDWILETSVQYHGSLEKMEIHAKNVQTLEIPIRIKHSDDFDNGYNAEFLGEKSIQDFVLNSPKKEQMTGTWDKSKHSIISNGELSFDITSYTEIENSNFKLKLKFSNAKGLMKAEECIVNEGSEKYLASSSVLDTRYYKVKRRISLTLGSFELYKLGTY